MNGRIALFFLTSMIVTTLMINNASALIFGNNVVEGSLSTLGGFIAGGEYAAPADGTIGSISVYIEGDWDAGEAIKCAMYDQNYDFIASTEERTTGGSGLFVFNFAFTFVFF